MLWGEDLTMFQAEDIAEWLANWGIGAYVLSILLNVVISILGVIPSVFLTMANVLVFGVIPGFFVSWIGEMVGAFFSFTLYRKGALRLEEKYLSKNRRLWFHRLQQMTPLRQFFAVLIARIIPYVPSALVTVISVMSQVRIPIYLLATGIGKAPSILLESFAGHGFKMIDDPRVKTGILILLLFSIIFILFIPRKLRSRKPEFYHSPKKG